MIDLWCDCFRPKFDGAIWQWADNRLLLPQSTRSPVYVAADASWLKQPFECITDPNIREITILGPAGSAKSLLGEIFIAWLIENAPGFTYYVWPTDDDGKDAMEDRILPMLENNEFLLKRLPVDRSKKRITKIIFSNMSLYSLGANERNAQSKRVKYLITEEPHTFEPGMLTQFRKRTEAVRNYKILHLSTGSVLEDQTDETFKAGSQHEWHVACPKCGTYQPLKDANLKWEKKPSTKRATTDSALCEKQSDTNARIAVLP